MKTRTIKTDQSMENNNNNTNQKTMKTMKTTTPKSETKKEQTIKTTKKGLDVQVATLAENHAIVHPAELQFKQQYQKNNDLINTAKDYIKAYAAQHLDKLFGNLKTVNLGHDVTLQRRIPTPPPAQYDLTQLDHDELIALIFDYPEMFKSLQLNTTQVNADLERNPNLTKATSAHQRLTKCILPAEEPTCTFVVTVASNSKAAKK